jgi:hypothetical protein
VAWGFTVPADFGYDDYQHAVAAVVVRAANRAGIAVGPEMNGYVGTA